MKTLRIPIIVIISLGFLYLHACKDSTSDGLQDSLSLFTDLELIEGATNTTLTINRGEQVGVNSSFQVELRDVQENEYISEGIKGGWCIEWKKRLRSNNDVHEGVRLYSTHGNEKWKPLHYYFSIRPQIEAADSTLTYREAQAVVWSLAGYMGVAPEFDLDKLQNDELPSSLMLDGEPNFSKEKVKEIVEKVKNEYPRTKLVSELDGGIVAETVGDEQDIYIPIEPARIEVQPDPATVLVSETVTMNATVFDEENNELTDVVVSWSIEDESIATISEDGVVTGLSAGETLVTATSDGISGTAVLIIEEEEPVPASIIFELNSVELTVSESVELSVTILDADGIPIPDVPIVWSTLDESIAIVDENGVLTGVNPGETEVVAEVEESLFKSLNSNNKSKLPLIESIPVIVEALPSDALEIIPETITAGDDHSCGLDTIGNAYCWGLNNEGQIGDGLPIGDEVSRNAPVQVTMPAGVTFVAISGGSEFTLALSSSGEVWAWGNNDSGQLGNSTTTNSTTPVPVDMPDGVSFVSVHAGSDYSLALSSTGVAYTWGRNNDGELGNGSSVAFSSIPVAVSMPTGIRFTSVNTNDRTTLALDESGKIWGWGDNSSSGQLGDGTFIDRSTPIEVLTPSGTIFTAVSAGTSHSLALDSDGNAWAWGSNDWGKLGINSEDGSSILQATEVSMPSGISFKEISAGGDHSVALDSEGNAWAWGQNNTGQLGDGTTVTNRTLPVAVSMPPGVIFKAISNGDWHTVTLTSGGQAYAWGENGDGQLGDGTTSDSSTPVKVQMPIGVIFE